MTSSHEVVYFVPINPESNMKYLTSGGMAPLGYSIPVAIGASFACHHSQKVFAIVGDGGFHISLQSLQLISQYNLNFNFL